MVTGRPGIEHICHLLAWLRDFRVRTDLALVITQLPAVVAQALLSRTRLDSRVEGRFDRGGGQRFGSKWGARGYLQHSASRLDPMHQLNDGIAPGEASIESFPSRGMGGQRLNDQLALLVLRKVGTGTDQLINHVLDLGEVLVHRLVVICLELGGLDLLRNFLLQQGIVCGEVGFQNTDGIITHLGVEYQGLETMHPS